MDVPPANSGDPAGSQAKCSEMSGRDSSWSERWPPDCEAPSLDVERAFVADSPFGKAGVLAESQVRPVNRVTGRPE